MKDYFPPKPLDYAGFIAELTELQRYSLSEESLQWRPDSIGFLKWRASLFDLLARIKKAGYDDVRCEVEDRQFQYYGTGEEKHAKNFFNKAIDETNIEMQLIIDNFTKHGDPHAAKPFDYAAFVAEISDLVARAERLKERDHEATVFREWRHETQDAINRVRRLRYPVACGLAQRTFMTRRIDGSLEVFNRDMEDTLIELRLIVKNFNKHGAPEVDTPLTFGKAPRVEDDKTDESMVAEAKPGEIVLPDKMSIPWIWHNSHWSVPVAAGSALIAVFSAGTVFGGTKAGQTVLSWFTPTPPTATATVQSPAHPLGAPAK